MPIDRAYLRALQDRSKKTRVYKKHQFIGLVLAELLRDEPHKALYMKLAKEFREPILFSIAKQISRRKDIKNKGAYFMKLLADPDVKRFRTSVAKQPRTKKPAQRSLFGKSLRLNRKISRSAARKK